MTGRRPDDPMGSRLWELEEGYCGESEHVDDLITLAWNIYHARDAALALAERRAGEIKTLRAALTDYRDRIDNITSGWGEYLPRDVMYSLSTSHYSVAALLDAALAAPPADAERGAKGPTP